MAPTLGQMLKNKAAAEAVAAADREQHAQDAARAQRKADHEAVVGLFATYKERITTSIREYGRFPTIKLESPHHERARIDVAKLLGVWTKATRIDSELHPDFDVWVAFRTWASEQELKVHIAYDFSDECNEAGPEESWFELRGEFA